MFTQCLLFSDPTSAFSIYNEVPTYVNDVVIWPTADLNIGLHYDNTTGKYCAEHTGTYMFQLHLYKQFQGGLVTCKIKKNSDTIAAAQVPSETVKPGFYEGSTSSIVHLEKGDKVYVGDCVNFNNLFQWTAFNGVLLDLD